MKEPESLKFKVDDLVVVYKGTPTYGSGTLAKIIDRDLHDGSYMVSRLEDVFKYQGDMNKLLRDSKWVLEENMSSITFDRPIKKKSHKGIISATVLVLFGIVVTELIRYYG